MENNQELDLNPNHRYTKRIRKNTKLMNAIMCTVANKTLWVDECKRKCKIVGAAVVPFDDDYLSVTFEPTGLVFEDLISLL